MLLATSEPLNIAAHWTSILPPIFAITMAIWTKRIYLSLSAGIVLAIALLGGHEYSHQPTTKADPSVTDSSASQRVWRATRAAVSTGAENHLWKQLSSESHLRVFVFTLLMGAMVGVMYRSGAMLGLVAALSPLARSRRGGQLVTWLLGMIIFFDDYANSLLLGNTMRPLADRLKISREKLAYIVDSTAAPVSGLALISSWVAIEISYIDAGLKGLAGLTNPPTEVIGNAFQIFLHTIPYRFYVIYALLFVPIVAWMRRDLGPMAKAEDAAWGKQALAESSSDSIESNARWYDAVIPIGIVVAVTLWLILETGLQKTTETEPTFFDIFGNGDSYIGLVYGALSGLLGAMGIAWIRGVAHGSIREAAVKGCLQVLPALAILWLSWSLSGLSEGLKTGEFLSDLVKQSQVPIWLLPSIVFILSAVVAFSTGTSWGTMAILVPLVVQVAYAMVTGDEKTESFDSLQPMMLASVGSVLAGAICGDHCSPISDTTILSSQASGCDHIQHVRTQMPYAMLVGLVSVVLGTIPAGLGVPAWILLPIGIGVLIFALRTLGKPTK